MDKKFNEIEISNFRGFDSIKIDRLSGLNVFVGANNVGKSTILEAVFMLVGMANPIMPMRVSDHYDGRTDSLCCKSVLCDQY